MNGGVATYKVVNPNDNKTLLKELIDARLDGKTVELHTLVVDEAIELLVEAKLMNPSELNKTFIVSVEFIEFRGTHKHVTLSDASGVYFKLSFKGDEDIIFDVFS